MNGQEILKNSLFFSFLDEADLAMVVGSMDVLVLKPGEILFEEDDESDFVCFVIEGLLEVIKYDSDHYDSRPITVLADGNSVGEMSLIDHQPRSATVRAISDSKLAILPQKIFNKLLSEDPVIGVKILKGLALAVSNNLRDTSSQLADEMVA